MSTTVKKNKAYEYRLYPNKEQRIFFAKSFGCTRFIWNKMLSDKNKHYEKTKESLYVDPTQYKDKFEWLKEVDSLALANVWSQLERAYKDFFRSPKVGFPKFKSKKHSKRSYTTNMIKNNIALEDGHIKLPKVGRVKCKTHRFAPSGYKLKSVTVKQTATGKYFASVLFEYESQVQKKDPKSFLGLDLSMHELYIDSNGDSPSFPHFYRTMEKKLAFEQRRLSLMKKDSNNHRKQRRKVAKIHEKIANQRKDFLHKVSRQIANVYDVVCVEDIDMKAMSQTLDLGKSVNDNGWGMFRTFLRYKLEDSGGQLIKIDRFFPSSQTCSVCGCKDPKTEDLSVRKWTCPHCGAHHDRDVNAAINIRNEGMRLLDT